MTNEERDLIAQFIQRVSGAPAGRAPGVVSGSVPSTLPRANNLPPIDQEADALIGDLLARHPDARYRLTQMAFVQEHALAEAQNTINRLRWELEQARSPQAPAPAPPSPWGAAARQQPAARGPFGGLFGGRQEAPRHAAPPQPQHAPGYQPGMFQRQGSGFLGSALTTAAGVAGGMLVGNMLMNAFSGGGAAEAASGASSPWTNPTGATDPYAQGGEPKDAAQADSGWSEASPVSYEEDPGDSGWFDAGSDEEF